MKYRVTGYSLSPRKLTLEEIRAMYCKLDGIPPDFRLEIYSRLFEVLYIAKV